MTTTYVKEPREMTGAPPRGTGCPVCGSTSLPHRPVRQWGELRLCTSCGLIFANPLALSHTPQELFSRAYSGKEARAGMEMFHHRLQWRADLLAGRAAPAPALANAQRRALDYLRRALPPGELVLDIGCGSGLFLETVRQAGYAVAGIEVAEPAALFLKQTGYRVFHGTVEEAPDGWADPALCTSFFVLHHVSDPIGFLQTIRRKYPRAPLVLTEHYLGTDPNKLAPLNLPPRRLTIWNQDSMRLALEKAGFAVETVELVPHEPYHPLLDGSLTRLYCALRGVIPARVRPLLIAVYLGAQRLVFGSLRAAFGNNTLLGQEHLLAIARPAQEK